MVGFEEGADDRQDHYCKDGDDDANHIELASSILWPSEMKYEPPGALSAELRGGRWQMRRVGVATKTKLA
jgi:hypothetical protein